MENLLSVVEMTQYQEFIRDWFRREFEKKQQKKNRARDNSHTHSGSLKVLLLGPKEQYAIVGDDIEESPISPDNLLDTDAPNIPTQKNIGDSDDNIDENNNEIHTVDTIVNIDSDDNETNEKSQKLSVIRNNIDSSDDNTSDNEPSNENNNKSRMTNYVDFALK